MIASRGTRAPLLIAGVGLTIGGVLLAFITASTPVWYAIVACMVFGLGMGWVNAPITNNAVSGMPRAQAGVAAGIASTSRQVGSSLGVAVVGSVLAGGLHGALSGTGVGSAADFTSAARPAWWIIAALGLAVLLLSLATTGTRGRASAERAAALITRHEHEEEPVAGIPARSA
jgi:MFS family permease